MYQTNIFGLVNMNCLALVISILAVTVANAVTTTTISVDPTVISSAQSAAAAADAPIFIEFLSDFATNMNSYTSYMNSNKMTLPQDVANYYFHISDISETSKLQQDLATSFPFSNFKTFITAFPWYESILSRASASTFYVPQDFITGDGKNAIKTDSLLSEAASSSPAQSTGISLLASGSSPSFQPNTTGSSGSSDKGVATSTGTNTNSFSTENSENSGVSINACISVFLIPFLGGLILI